MHKTANGVEITDGLAVWTNELNLATVKVGEFEARPGFDGWFDTVTWMSYDGTVRLGGCTGPIMNGERLTTRHPFTGEMAADRLALIRDPGPKGIHVGTFRGACKDYDCDGSCRG